MKANIRVKRLKGKKMKSCKQINAQILEVKTFFFFTAEMPGIYQRWRSIKTHVLQSA